MSIYVTRHGQTSWNVEKKVQGKADIELNEVGIMQANEIKEKLKDKNIDLIICSPLKRAKQTAKIINEDRDVLIIYDDRLIERDFGEFEGLKTDKFDFSGFWNYEKDKEYEKAENIKDFFKRVYNFLDEIKDKYRDKNILLVAHGGISVPIYCYFNGVPINKDDLLEYALNNCEYLKYEF